ncbi:predicted protein [Plenodomus lingam JN3]|uniref:Uncharacterized protein n=1 Tax=Leptosphaeria maculans (strain JN3 / isolate v23.1.3 / race Av1-4-5-6-7-8) TaxID=985895 RepID=M1ZJK1_LEPMJ|nr:predicted protein [Plenodomus lingam JN3]
MSLILLPGDCPFLIGYTTCCHGPVTSQAIGEHPGSSRSDAKYSQLIRPSHWDAFLGRCRLDNRIVELNSLREEPAART